MGDGPRVGDVFYFPVRACRSSCHTCLGKPVQTVLLVVAVVPLLLAVVPLLLLLLLLSERRRKGSAAAALTCPPVGRTARVG